MNRKTFTIGALGILFLSPIYHVMQSAAAQQHAHSQTTAHTSISQPAPHPEETFIARYYPRGVPFSEAKKITLTDTMVDALIKRHCEGDIGFRCSNVIVTMGITGNPKAVDTLIEFVKRPLEMENEKYIPWAEVRAKRSALIALGYLINRHKDKTIPDRDEKKAERAVEFLCDILDNTHLCFPKKEDWKKKTHETKWSDVEISMGIKSYIEDAACLGLALSGSDQGGAILEQLEASVGGALSKIGGGIAFVLTEFSGFVSDFADEEIADMVTKKTLSLISLVEPNTPSRVAQIREARKAYETTKKGQKS